MTYEKLIQEMDGKLQFPGLSNTWTMPVENRLDMELPGIKTPVGLKIQGPSVEGILLAGALVQQVLSTLNEMRSIFAERVAEGFYINVEVDRAEAAPYGLTVADVQRAVSSELNAKACSHEDGSSRTAPNGFWSSREGWLAAGKLSDTLARSAGTVVKPKLLRR